MQQSFGKMHLDDASNAKMHLQVYQVFYVSGN